MLYPGEQSAFPVVVLNLDDVIHDEPSPDVKIPGTADRYNDDLPPPSLPFSHL